MLVVHWHRAAGRLGPIIAPLKQNTDLKAPSVGKNIPTVANVTQGEVSKSYCFELNRVAHTRKY